MKIELQPWHFICADGCCYEHGIVTKVDGVEVSLFGNQNRILLGSILTHLGHNVEIVGLDVGGEVSWRYYATAKGDTKHEV